MSEYSGVGGDGDEELKQSTYFTIVLKCTDLWQIKKDRIMASVNVNMKFSCTE